MFNEYFRDFQLLHSISIEKSVSYTFAEIFAIAQRSHHSHLLPHLPEFIALQNDIKRVVRMQVPSSILSQVKEFCKQFHFSCDYFLGTIAPPPSTPHEPYYTVAISKKKSDSSAYCYYEKNLDTHPEYSKIVGEMLSYPDCCIDFYISQNTSCDLKRIELAYHQSDHFSYLLNNFILNSPYYLVSHFPHSYDCSKSKKFSEALFNIIDVDFPRYSFVIKKVLISNIILFDYLDLCLLALDENSTDPSIVDFFQIGSIANSIHLDKNAPINDIMKVLPTRNTRNNCSSKHAPYYFFEFNGNKKN